MARKKMSGEKRNSDNKPMIITQCDEGSEVGRMVYSGSMLEGRGGFPEEGTLT